MTTFFKINNKRSLASTFKLGFRNGKAMTVEQAVQDGDTIDISPTGYLGIRFLTIATPEVSLQRPKSYNYRILEMGLAESYFLFPNIAPFRATGHPLDSMVHLHKPADILSRSHKLREARIATKEARAANVGVFPSTNPIQLSPFELRFLTCGEMGRRRVVNLGVPEDKNYII